MIRLNDLRPHFLPDVRVLGDAAAEVRALRAWSARERFGPSEMTYVTASRVAGTATLREHPASVFITDFDPGDDDLGAKTLLLTARPRMLMARLSHLFARAITTFGDERTADAGSPPSIAASARVHPRAWIDRDVVIGDDTIVHANATILRGVTIGRRCIVQPGAVIGAEGFGYERGDDGRWFRIAHLGGVVIGDDVEIGSNACVDRGTLGDTMIEDGAKIDNLVHVAHNVRVGRDAVVIANAMLGGSSVVADGAYVAPSATIRDGRTIGAGATVGLGSVVTRDVPPGVTVLGVPAKPKDRG